MFKLAAIIAFLALLSGNSFAHEHHAKHGFILFGNNETYASHKVYKEPHHFQVILELSLPDEVKKKYLDAKATFPNDLILFVLDPMDLASISSAAELSGVVIREDQNHIKFEIASNVRVGRDQFKVLYLNELPLSLGAGYLETSSSSPVVPGRCECCW